MVVLYPVELARVELRLGVHKALDKRPIANAFSWRITPTKYHRQPCELITKSSVPAVAHTPPSTPTTAHTAGMSLGHPFARIARQSCGMMQLSVLNVASV